MAVNSDKVTKWKTDTVASVDFYNKWFLRFAPKAYRETRQETTKQVTAALQATNNMRDISAEVLRSNPHVLPTLRMATAPPLAVDRLIGLACVPGNLVKTMNTNGKIPPRMSEADLKRGLESIGVMLESLADKGIFTWLETAKTPGEEELYRAATIVADRLCGAMANPIIRNAQETRQLAAIKEWLESRSYTHLATGQGTKADSMNEAMTIRSTLIPTSRAALGSKEQASMARPKIVRLKNPFSSARTTTAIPKIQRLCGTMVAPRRWIGVVPEKAGRT